MNKISVWLMFIWNKLERKPSPTTAVDPSVTGCSGTGIGQSFSESLVKQYLHFSLAWAARAFCINKACYLDFLDTKVVLSPRVFIRTRVLLHKTCFSLPLCVKSQLTLLEEKLCDGAQFWGQFPPWHIVSRLQQENFTCPNYSVCGNSPEKINEYWL